MSSAVDLRVERSVELYGRLKDAVADFVKREELLTRDIRTRRTAAERKNRDGITKVESRFETQTAAIEADFKETEERARATYESRRLRIQKARANGLKNLPKLAANAKKKWMGNLQMRHFRAERTLASGMAALEKDFAEFGKKLGELKESLGKVEKGARRGFSGYGSFLRLLGESKVISGEARHTPPERDRLFEDAEAHLELAEERLAEFRRFPIAKAFGYLPLPIVAIVLAVGCAVGVVLGGAPLMIPVVAGTVVVFAIVCVLYFVGKKQVSVVADQLAGVLAAARWLRRACSVAAQNQYDADCQRLQAEFDRTAAEVLKGWNRADTVESEFETATRQRIEARAPRAFERNARLLQPKLARIEPAREERRAAATNEAESKRKQITEVYEKESAEVAAAEKTGWEALEGDWKRTIFPLYRQIEEMNAALAADFPDWSAQYVQNWTVPTRFAPGVRFGRLDLDLQKLGAPKDARLALPGPAQVSAPLALTFPERGSLLLETNESGAPAVMNPLNNVMLRLLTTTPPGKITFTVIDPVGLGENFAGVMHLSDYEEALINRRIWTQRDQIEERLAELSAHIEKVIQMYLRNEYATITEYNEQAGSVAEKYHFLVVADFPSGFSETAARRLQSVALSGPRCGIFTLIHWDQRQALPEGLVADELRKNSVCIRRQKDEFLLTKEQGGVALTFDPPPEPEVAVELVHKIGKASIDSNRVEVPFVQIAPKPEEMWLGETTSELRVAVGRTGATKLQYLAIGKGTRQHALFAGKTGSGKSTLFHVIITNLALTCSPEQVEFYLIDFKKGVEFKCYAAKHLPHARVVAIESDREFGLNVLQRVDDELKRRGEIFRKMGVQDIPGYKREGGTEPMPRTLLIIDEFQEFFVEDDTVAQNASLLFDRIVRQGRAFGIHVLLGSQTLGGAYTLARATLGQMVIRVALQCNEADAYLIMDDTNSAPRLLSRPGEGIYNDAAGAVEGNSPFQVVWLPDEERDQWLDKVHEVAVQKGGRYPAPIVFEGNAPADIRENELLRDLRAVRPARPPAAGRVWLGAPNSIKGPTEAVFHRQSGNHLLIVGQREEATLTMTGLSLLALGAQYPSGAARFVLLHAATPESREAIFLEQILKATPHEVTVARNQEIAGVMSELAAELKARSNGSAPPDAPPIYLIIHGLHKFKKLRHEDDFSFSSSDSDSQNSGAQLTELITEGSSQGIHIIATVDSFNNVNRSMNRKALTEFEMRVVFQMSANDSASLIDSPKASNLGLHRALYYNEHDGTLETFRPYAVPDGDWIGKAEREAAVST